MFSNLIFSVSWILAIVFKAVRGAQNATVVVIAGKKTTVCTRFRLQRGGEWRGGPCQVQRLPRHELGIGLFSTQRLFFKNHNRIPNYINPNLFQHLSPNYPQTNLNNSNMDFMDFLSLYDSDSDDDIFIETIFHVMKDLISEEATPARRTRASVNRDRQGAHKPPLVMDTNAPRTMGHNNPANRGMVSQHVMEPPISSSKRTKTSESNYTASSDVRSHSDNNNNNNNNNNNDDDDDDDDDEDDDDDDDDDDEFEGEESQGSMRDKGKRVALSMLSATKTDGKKDRLADIFEKMASINDKHIEVQKEKLRVKKEECEERRRYEDFKIITENIDHLSGDILRAALAIKNEVVKKYISE